MKTTRALALCIGLLALASQAHAAPSAKLGAACADDVACGPGLTCLTVGAGATEGVPSGGLCTVSCAGQPKACDAIAPGARCVSLALGGTLGGDYCLEGCSSDEPEVKCHGRADVACAQDVATTLACTRSGNCRSWTKTETYDFCSYDADGTGRHCDSNLCVPRCSRDDGCPAGLRCDPSTGLCDSSGRQGAAPGAQCADDAQCAGTCGWSFWGPNTCVERCVVGSPCGPEGAANARCFDPYGAQVGDLGQCAVLCNCGLDCAPLGAGWSCVDATSADVEIFGFVGFCVDDSFGTADGGVIDECNPTASGCVYGKTVACRGADACLGVAKCQSDGTYAQCVCPALDLDAGITPPKPPKNRHDAAILDAGDPDAARDTLDGGARDASAGASAPRDADVVEKPRAKQPDGGLCSALPPASDGAPDGAGWLLAGCVLWLVRRRQGRCRARDGRRAGSQRAPTLSLSTTHSLGSLKA
jgi:hypothetical protein